MTCTDTKPFPFIAANKKSIAQRALVRGVGVNDADYVVAPKINGKQITCPFYVKWHSMMARCYSTKLHEKHPTYGGCSVVGEWLLFSRFRKWMATQDWQGKELDKDIVFPGNKVYGPETCVFVRAAVNTLLMDRGAVRGDCPQGVRWLRRGRRFEASIALYGTPRYLGIFKTAEEAEAVYLAAKCKHILAIAENESDVRVQQGLRRHAGMLLVASILV